MTVYRDDLDCAIDAGVSALRALSTLLLAVGDNDGPVPADLGHLVDMVRFHLDDCAQHASDQQAELFKLRPNPLRSAWGD